MQKVLLIHDVMAAFADLRAEVVGIEDYSWRSLVMRGDKVVNSHRDLYPVLNYLRSVGIGYGKVYALDADNLLEHCATNNAARDIVSKYNKLSLFAITQDCYSLIPDSWKIKFNLPEVGICDLANDKAFMRELSVELGLEAWLPRNYIVHTIDEVKAAIDNLTYGSNLDFYVVKDVNLASGIGMHFLTGREDTLKYAKRMFAESSSRSKLIIEAGFDKLGSYSIYWEISNSSVYFRGVSEQLMEADGKTHAGNVLTADNRIPSLRDDEVEKIKNATLPFAMHFMQRGYNGPFVIDFIKTKSSQILLLEINARVTASSFLYEVSDQLKENGLIKFGIASNICYTKVENWKELKVRLMEMNLLFNGTKGIIPLMVNSLRYGKFIIISVESDSYKALSKMQIVKDKLK